MTESNSFTLQSIINEFKNISPEISSAFMFKKNGKIIANDNTTTEESMNNLINAFLDITEKAEVVGGLENITIQATNSQVSITPIEDYYLATVSSRAVDQKIIKALTHVFVPTVVKLADQAATASIEKELSQTKKLHSTAKKGVSTKIKEETATEPDEAVDQILPQPPVNQFMIEKISGIFPSQDTVQIDNTIISEWTELYGDKKIVLVNIETLTGKTTKCKFKPIKEARFKGKGVIQVPEKILQTLQTSKGTLVMVKPVID